MKAALFAPTASAIRRLMRPELRCRRRCMRSPRRPRSRSRTALARDRGAGRATSRSLPAGARDIAGGLAPVVGDEREGDETYVEQLASSSSSVRATPLTSALRASSSATRLTLSSSAHRPHGRGGFRHGEGSRAGASRLPRRGRTRERSGACLGSSLGHRDCTESRFSEPAIGPETEPRHGKARRSGGRCGGLSRLLPAGVEDAAVRIAQCEGG